MKYLKYYMRMAAYIAVAIGICVVVIGLGLLGVLTIFGSFFFESVPDIRMALKHMAIFSGGVLSFTAAVMLASYAMNWLLNADL